MSIKTFKYRIYPSKGQITILNQTLEDCRMLYNHFLDQRKSSWIDSKESVGCYDQISTLAFLKEERKSLKNVHSQVLQNVAIRVDLAFQAFFRRVKKGDTPGHPRFKSYGRYDLFTFPQSGFKLNDNYVRVSKVGNVKIVAVFIFYQMKTFGRIITGKPKVKRFNLVNLLGEDSNPRLI